MTILLICARQEVCSTPESFLFAQKRKIENLGLIGDFRFSHERCIICDNIKGAIADDYEIIARCSLLIAFINPLITY